MTIRLKKLSPILKKGEKYNKKSNSALFCSFISAVGLLASLLFMKLNRLSRWSNNWWDGINSKKSCCRLDRIIFME